MKDKNFDAVRMMRVIRDKLSEIYTKRPRSEETRFWCYKAKIGDNRLKMIWRTSMTKRIWLRYAPLKFPFGERQIRSERYQPCNYSWSVRVA